MFCFERMFNPLDELAQIVINLKLFQEICTAKCSWDDDLKEEFQAKWEKVMKNLITFTSVQVAQYLCKG